jgi:hypothetical protein
MDRFKLAKTLLVMVAAVTGKWTAWAGEGPDMTMKIESTAFAHNGLMPRQFTCEGQDLSPALAFSGIPARARSLALIVDDPDAPDPAAPRMTWVHWILYNLPPDTARLQEGVRSKDLPPGAKEGQNDSKRTGYGGPCPPIGTHRYVHKLYALDTVLPNLNNPGKAQLEQAMKGHVLAEAQLIGLYRKIGK